MNTDNPQKSLSSGLIVFLVLLMMALFVAVGALGYLGLRDVKTAIAQQADLVRESNQASRDALVTSQRAYILATETQVNSGEANGTEQTQIVPKWENTGNTPANPVILEVRCPIMVEKNQEIPKQDMATPAGQQLQAPSQPVSRLKAIFAPKQAMPGGACIFSKDQLVLLLPSKPHLFLTARAIYRDAFAGTPLHITEYCTDTMIGKGADNKFIFQTNLCDKFNCTDDQCPQAERDEVEKEYGKL
jgi:hypothetical protein